jgi:dipeptidyl aminopeptidase/acylaminoacyl peptidase
MASTCTDLTFDDESTVATFSDLRTVASERAPFFASKRNIESALRIAEDLAKFKVDDVSPVLAAARIGIPVLVIHGEADKETSPAHSAVSTEHFTARRS